MPSLSAKTRQLLELCQAKAIRITTAESCTGGLIAAKITSVSGASEIFDKGWVTYSNQAKTEMLGVPAALIATHGAVSAEVACAMAEGALERSPAHVSVAVTGIAGPGGGSIEKPVGLVYIAIGAKGKKPQSHHCHFIGTRAAIRRQAVEKAIDLLLEHIR